MLGNSPGVGRHRNNRILLFDPSSCGRSDGSSPHARSRQGDRTIRLHAAGPIAVQAEPSASVLNQPNFAVAPQRAVFVADSRE